jgi:hypothetical protein
VDENLYLMSTQNVERKFVGLIDTGLAQLLKSGQPFGKHLSVGCRQTFQVVLLLVCQSFGLACVVLDSTTSSSSLVSQKGPLHSIADSHEGRLSRIRKYLADSLKIALDGPVCQRT